MNTDPLTGRPLPANAIQRILYIAPKIHLYTVPPAKSTKGYEAASWPPFKDPSTNEDLILRLRLLETSIPGPNDTEKVSTTILLDFPKTGELFAAAPYTSERVVEQALDSSRFFAVTVISPDGRKAVLGIGYEDRTEAFDFNIALQDARRALGLEKPAATGPPGRKANKKPEEPKRDFSLKEGQTISINLGGLKGRRSRPDSASPADQKSEQEALFSIKPPPGPGSEGQGGGGGGGMPFLPPPPTAQSVKEERRRSRQTFEQTPQDLGFDDGEFGEFQ